MWGRTQTFPAESLTKISPSGETIVCNDPAGHTDIYQRKSVGGPAGEWVRQRIEFSIKEADFNQEGYLLAVVPETNTRGLILFALTADGNWQERARLQTENSIAKFCFSPCSRSLKVTGLPLTMVKFQCQRLFPSGRSCPIQVHGRPTNN
ncbi:hypothetical protein [Endozoicomonas sp. GU-1]|uniref:hypothetical protein n=1 Tax=Endozoicomonas sp. GU-1 TaxID=3009078 RepID=UPI0022B4645C|nr:hypothetical protein [Endozoicomonas sp. GU-1]WBA81632.1 hypothetical protein O2T12_00145 [Endozoicomonas sp. GU-1]